MATPIQVATLPLGVIQSWASSMKIEPARQKTPGTAAKTTMPAMVAQQPKNGTDGSNRALCRAMHGSKRARLTHSRETHGNVTRVITTAP